MLGNLNAAQFGTNVTSPTGANSNGVSSNGQGEPGSSGTTTTITVRGDAPALTTRSG